MDEVIQKAREMRAKFYEQSSLMLPLAINTEKFARVVGEELGIKIEQQLIPGSHMPHLLGLFARRRNGDVLILVSDENNTCWRRFVFMKELCHAFLGETFCSDAGDLANALIYRDMEQNGHEFQRELSGVVAAIEIMIPEHLEGRLRREVNVNQIDSKTLAGWMKVPQRFLDYRLNQWEIPIISPPVQGND